MNLRKKAKTTTTEEKSNPTNKQEHINSSDDVEVYKTPEKRKTQNDLNVGQAKKKKRKPSDGNFSNKTYSYGAADGIKKKKPVEDTHEYRSMLYDVDETFLDIKGNEKPIKTSVMIDFQALYEANKDKDIDWQLLGEALVACFEKEVKCFRPMDKVIDFSSTGSPVKGTTPDGKTVLTRTKSIGFLSFYDNREVKPLSEVKSATSLDVTSDFLTSPSFLALLDVKAAIKKQEALITEKLLKETREDNAQKSGRSQNTVMIKKGRLPIEGSADAYSNASGLFNFEVPMKWQWLHLIPHFVWGDKAQIPDDLVTGTKSANADMDSVEAQLNKLAKKYPKGFKLIAEAVLIPGTHIGISMKYYIKTDDFCLPFEFNLQNPTKPHVSQTQIMNQFIKNLLDMPQRQSKAKKTLEASFPFFDKNDKQAIGTTTTTITHLSDDLKTPETNISIDSKSDANDMEVEKKQDSSPKRIS